LYRFLFPIGCLQWQKNFCKDSKRERIIFLFTWIFYTPPREDLLAQQLPGAAHVARPCFLVRLRGRHEGAEGEVGQGEEEFFHGDL
jgi:hypothetical protein